VHRLRQDILKARLQRLVIRAVHGLKVEWPEVRKVRKVELSAAACLLYEFAWSSSNVMEDFCGAYLAAYALTCTILVVPGDNMHDDLPGLTRPLDLLATHAARKVGLSLPARRTTSRENPL
jgi:hypothetical protein